MTIARRRLVLATPLAPLVASCATSLQGYRTSTLAEVAAAMGVCSAAYATLSGGRIVRVAAVSGCGGGAEPPADAVFQAASLTKPVVAYAVLQLAQAGQLDLAAPVSRYLPAGYRHFHSVLARGAGDAADTVPPLVLDGIPLATLLNHGSGLPNWSNRPMSLAFEPGTGWRYSGEGYMLLQSVVEAVTGQGFEGFIDAHVFGPLGMRHSSLVWKPAYALQAQAGGAPLWSPGSTRFNVPVAAASLHTTAGDYARFLAALLADRRLCELIVSAPVPVAPALGIEWGYGWGMERQAQGANLWHWGNNPGFRSFTMVSPASGSGFVLFTASDRGMPLAVPLAYEVLPMEHNAFRFEKVG